jgi:hypothetical protein
MANREIRIPLPLAVAVLALLVGFAAGSLRSSAAETEPSQRSGEWVMEIFPAQTTSGNAFLYSRVTGEIWQVHQDERKLVKAKGQ